MSVFGGAVFELRESAHFPVVYFGKSRESVCLSMYGFGLELRHKTEPNQRESEKVSQTTKVSAEKTEESQFIV